MCVFTCVCVWHVCVVYMRMSVCIHGHTLHQASTYIVKVKKEAPIVELTLFENTFPT